jgi:hypothetical protein
MTRLKAFSMEGRNDNTPRLRRDAPAKTELMILSELTPD